jgi:hypothetical protein
MMTGALAAAPAEAHHTGPQPGPVNAANTYRWGQMNWRYEHEEPGFRPWHRSNSGSTTAYIRWGMILLDSSVNRFRRPSRGSVSTTLHRRGARYGRWELRLRAPVWYAAGRDYRVLADLVPADPAKRRCNGIGLASFAAGGSRVHVFARNAGKQWTYTKRGMTLDRHAWHTYAVEVTPRRISWFIDAHVAATVRNSQATPDLPLTPRLSLLGVPDAAMDRARIGVDWVRHWTLERPNRKSVRAPAPAVTTQRGC